MSKTDIKPHMLFLFSDTGGGHRSASEAIIEALQLEFGDQVTTEMVDIFKDYGPRLLDKVPELYPKMIKRENAWAFGYHLSDDPRMVKALSNSTVPMLKKFYKEMIDDHPCDLIVSVHPIPNKPILKILGKNRPPYVTVVTDMISTHAAWFDPDTDLCIVPTSEARNRAIEVGVHPNKIKIVGLPVADRFCQQDRTADEIRNELGWPLDIPIVVIVGGGEGMGPLEQTARAIADTGLEIAMVIITGRNKELKAKLEGQKWPVPTFIYGFVREMPDFMKAADILVTKAGPGTINEALNAGLPIILYSRLPGQEEGNVDFVVQTRTGVWAPKPDEIARVVHKWVTQPEEYEKTVQACKIHARPNAARDIAHLLIDTIHQHNPNSPKIQAV